MIASLQLNLGNVHCRHILFGCSHDNGYARLLEDIAQDQDAAKINLLEGVPFEREFAQLNSSFAKTKFENLFRKTKIDLYSHSHPQSYGVQISSMPTIPSPKTSNAVPHVPNDQYPVGYVSPYSQGLARTPSSSTSNSAGAAPASWASKAMSAPPVQAQLASPPPTPQPPTVPRNKHGQRIDPLIKVDMTDYKRVQSIKMCNVHYIRKDCSYGDRCTHDHQYKPTKNELGILRQIARSTPCRFGTDCDDLKCIYGHR